MKLYFTHVLICLILPHFFSQSIVLFLSSKEHCTVIKCKYFVIYFVICDVLVNISNT